jgi:hypothetical protein
METTVKLPDNFYERLYDSIMDYGFDPDSTDEKTCSMSIEIDDFTVDLEATFDVHIEDLSFDHAFGTEYIYDIEVGELEDIEVTQIWHCDDDSETEVTDLFDMNKFWLQFKQFVIKRGSHYIHHGDEVVVTTQNTKYRRWVKMTFLYYDTRLGLAICTPSLYAKYVRKHAYPYVFPATTQNLRLVK